jgi:hypothetical protein
MVLRKQMSCVNAGSQSVTLTRQHVNHLLCMPPNAAENLFLQPARTSWGIYLLQSQEQLPPCVCSTLAAPKYFLIGAGKQVDVLLAAHTQCSNSAMGLLHATEQPEVDLLGVAVPLLDQCAEQSAWGDFGGLEPRQGPVVLELFQVLLHHHKCVRLRHAPGHRSTLRSGSGESVTVPCLMCIKL